MFRTHHWFLKINLLLWCKDVGLLVDVFKGIGEDEISTFHGHVTIDWDTFRDGGTASGNIPRNQN